MENPATKQQSVGRRVRTVTLIPLEADDGDQFVRDNQAAFKYGSLVVRRRRRAGYSEVCGTSAKTALTPSSQSFWNAT